jgi:hypothetical protein
MAEVIEVTPAQFDAIEAAWSICSWRDPRRAKELWATAFRGCVADVIGREPPDEFTLRKVGEQLALLDPAEELAAAKADPNGRELSPAAQALYEKEGAARFAQHHPAARFGRPYDPEFPDVR